jgi:hypothetical protein
MLVITDITRVKGDFAIKSERDAYFHALQEVREIREAIAQILRKARQTKFGGLWPVVVDYIKVNALCRKPGESRPFHC